MTPSKDAVEIMEEMEQALADKEAVREERDLGEQPTGMRLSQKTNIQFAGEEVPGRTRAYRSDDGREVWLNTAELPYHLSKRLPNGKRVFVMKKPPMAERVPLDIECRICARMNGYSRRFYDNAQYQDHMEILHPRENERERRDQDRQERLEERAVLRALAERGVTNGAEQVKPEPEVAAEVQSGPAPWTCEVCGRGFSVKIAYINHKKVHAVS
jgi:hypothetical protein